MLSFSNNEFIIIKYDLYFDLLNKHPSSLHTVPLISSAAKYIIDTLYTDHAKKLLVTMPTCRAYTSKNMALHAIIHVALMALVATCIQEIARLTAEAFFLVG